MFNFLRKTALWIVLIPWAIFGVGFASNQLVLIANHDTFPVEANTIKERILVAKATVKYQDMAQELSMDPDLPAGMIDDTHCLMTSKTHLNFLADVFDRGNGIYSIGDFLLSLSEWLGAFSLAIWVFEVIRRLGQE